MEQFYGDLSAGLHGKIERSFASVFIYRSMQVDLACLSKGPDDDWGIAA
ncbi:MAG: hypothetical protein LUO89_16050 [Methanothrix sp.]|nr:hypothetical protein [Methanothrix sp.]